ncbi:MAG: hypothetical protein PHD54_15330 [Desulfuromonadaceae bacterium]|nr:hypothetical protein [Desulfuromonadaceae bacterium]
MKTAHTEVRNQIEKPRRTSFKATLNALLGMSYTHFPLILPGVHPLLTTLILYRLKKRGFSNCRVEVAGRGLVVYAVR